MGLVRLRPVLKSYLWGGERLPREFGLGGAGERVAEGWMLSAHPAGDCAVAADGAQRPFSDYIAGLRRRDLGARYDLGKPFPLLVKLIDAALPLSVQVHPDDDYAARVEHGAGKTEMWYIVDCAPGASIYRGVRPGVTRAAFEQAAARGSVTELLERVPVQKGAAYFIPAGTVHAIGAGCLICEVQQSADITYRVDDFGRLDADGSPRALHLDKALAVMDFAAASERPLDGLSPDIGEGLCGCRYFRCYRRSAAVPGAITLNGDSFVSLIALDGAGEIATAAGGRETYRKGDSFFVTADSGEVFLSGDGDFLLTTL